MRSLLLILAIFILQSNADIQLCAKDDDLLQWKRIDFSPDTVYPGDTLVVNGEGSLLAPLNETTTRVHIRLRMGMVKLLDKWFEFCPLLRRLSDEFEKQWPPSLPRQCPVAKGEYSLSNYSVTLPAKVPPGRYQMDILIVIGEEDEQQRQVTCATVRLTVKRKSPSSVISRQLRLLRLQ